jgi:hypothetical protein
VFGRQGVNPHRLLLRPSPHPQLLAHRDGASLSRVQAQVPVPWVLRRH